MAEAAKGVDGSEGLMGDPEEEVGTSGLAGGGRLAREEGKKR